MMKVRPYEEKDKKNVQFVCLNSEGPSKRSKREENFVLSVYCDYYIEKEPENCFVAVDENDRVVGYILCAENFDAYKSGFLTEYFPEIKKWEYRRKKSALRSFIPQEEYKDEYPAHLHIDILPEYQRMGLGHKLTAILIENLKKKSVKGIVLTVWIRNYKGRRFYEKYGFTLLEERKNVAVYGLKL